MSFAQSKWVWMNGDVVPWEKATVHVSAHALHYGSGVFEGIRCYSGERGAAVFRLSEHLDRLRSSAGMCRMEIPFSKAELADAVCEVIRRNGFSNCYVRPICFYGSGTLSLNPAPCPVESIVMAWPWDTYLGAVGLEHGVRVTVSPWRKFTSDSAPTSVKACGQYINSVLALRDAVSRGFAEALLLDSRNNLAEGSGENLFIVKNGSVFTNDERDSILPGITRDAIIHIARRLGYAIQVQSLSLEELLEADEAFFTGTAAEVAPVVEVDGVIIGNGQPGEITRQIQARFFEVTQGKGSSYDDWLYPISPQENPDRQELASVS